ncbi:hypothetical protein CCMA1212_006355 [Trichoderma ghanense]|uniref:Uncharacterized protein n=1 Tax=Trichoderma ghanense TaxID=65468 RepID=A0ABY2H0P3_9HYPO
MLATTQMVERWQKIAEQTENEERKGSAKQNANEQSRRQPNNENECVNAASWLAERAAMRRTTKMMEEEEEEEEEEEGRARGRARERMEAEARDGGDGVNISRGSKGLPLAG